MRSERRAILRLVAAGRISAVEAERLLRAWNDAREEGWILAACLLICATQIHLSLSLHGAGHLIEGLAREFFSVWNAAFAMLTRGIGGGTV
jgi:hypothetical protein